MMRQIKEVNSNYIVTDADGMVASYLLPMLEDNGPLAELTLFHCAGTDEDADAMEINHVATERLLDSMTGTPPANIVYLSSCKVYSPDAGKDVDESRPTFAWSDAGRSRIRTEQLLEKWAKEHGSTLTVVRPALTFGRGVSGDMLRLFNRVVRGHYVHIRGNDAMMSAVTALDVAKAMMLLAGKAGVFNVSDGRQHTWLELAEAMTANAGAGKRMTCLPEKWASWIYRYFRWLPIVEETLGKKALEPVSRTLTLDNSRVLEATGIDFHDTLAVIARTAKDYPYEDS